MVKCRYDNDIDGSNIYASTFECGGQQYDRTSFLRQRDM